MKSILKILVISMVVSTMFSACDQAEKKEETHTDAADGYYTCSMHPQVHSDKPGKCPICGMDLIFVSGKGAEGFKLSEEEMLLGNITTQTAEPVNFNDDLILTGKVISDPTHTEELTAWVKGRIDELNFEETGARVNKGDLLYKIYSEELVKIQNDYLLALKKRQMAKGLDLDYDQIVNSAKNKLIRYGLSAAQVSQLAKTGKVWESVPVYSQRSGVITNIPVQEGDYVMEGQPVYKLSDFSGLWVEAQVYATETSWLHKAEKAEVRIEGFPEKLEGKISFVNPELEKGSKINLVRVEISNKEGKIMPGMQAYVTIKTGKREGIVVSRDAVLRDEMGASMWVKDSLGNYAVRMVRLGPEKDFKVEVLSGLGPGEEYVASGVYLLNSEYVLKKGTGPMEGMPGMNHQH
jgi:Cu(I)/Ag(I) efflux system membrane fusion protein